ncbi:MAG: UbiX family flavin prenyltransferase [Actinomycetes bacterium]
MMSIAATGARPDRLVVAVSGASGAVYAYRMLHMLSETTIETHLVMSKAARRTLVYETGLAAEDLEMLADVVHPAGDIGASIASGSFRTCGMVVVPCSIKTMSEIAYGIAGNLISRAADVTLKERRRLVLMVRETPLHAGHLRAMLAVTEMGGIIAPPVPALYAKPESIEDIVDHSVARVLDLFDIQVGHIRRWGEDLDLTPLATPTGPNNAGVESADALAESTPASSRLR